MPQTGKNLPAMQDTPVQSLGQEDALEKGMATHSGILAWRIPQRILAGYSPWGSRELDTTEWLTLLLHFQTLQNFSTEGISLKRETPISRNFPSVKYRIRS